MPAVAILQVDMNALATRATRETGIKSVKTPMSAPRNGQKTIKRIQIGVTKTPSATIPSAAIPAGAKRDLRVTVRFALTLMSALRRRLIAASSPPAATREALTTAAATVVTAEMEKLAKTLMNARYQSKPAARQMPPAPTP